MSNNKKSEFQTILDEELKAIEIKSIEEHGINLSAEQILEVYEFTQDIEHGRDYLT